MSVSPESGELLAGVLRAVGASHIALSLAHVVIWQRFEWTREIASLTPLTARVFAVHTFFIAFVLALLGLLALGRPDLLVAPSDLARLALGGLVLFWLLRLLAQPFVFDPVLLRGSPYRTTIRSLATALFASYVVVYGWALARQVGGVV